MPRTEQKCVRQQFMHLTTVILQCVFKLHIKHNIVNRWDPADCLLFAGKSLSLVTAKFDFNSAPISVLWEVGFGVPKNPLLFGVPKRGFGVPKNPLPLWGIDFVRFKPGSPLGFDATS